jgi:aspartate/tyrosine/aromatic aminotransferase
MEKTASRQAGAAFAETFWKADGKTVQPKPQNPIAGKQLLYNKDPRPEKVSLAQGMVFNDRDRTRVHCSKTGAWFDSEGEAREAGCTPPHMEVFCNKEGKIYHSPAVFVAERRALEQFGKEQFGDDLGQNPAAYGTPTASDMMEVIAYDGDDIYGDGQYDGAKTISFQTLGMASGYKHLTLPVLNSVRDSLGLPPLTTVIMGSNFYGAYPATFDGQTIVRYRYMDDNGEFDLASFKKAAAAANPKTTLFLFDMSTGNNFVGVKRTAEDNANIADVLIGKKLYSEHDIAYPNFDPDFNLNGELFRVLQKAEAPHGVQSSRGKKDKYASRLAFHHIYLGAGEQRKEILSHLIMANRNRFLAMPKTWGYLAEIARDPKLKAAQKYDEKSFVDIVNASRNALADKLGWDWMTRRAGMFDMVPTTHEGIEKLGELYAIYAVPARDQNLLGGDGQPVEVARIKHGIPTSKIDHVAKALGDIVPKYPSEQGRPNPEIITAS